MMSHRPKSVGGWELAAHDDPLPAVLIPESAQTRYLQYLYVAEDKRSDRAMLDRAADVSSSSDVHEQYHPTPRSIVGGSSSGDLIFVNVEGTVVYSVEENIDVETRLVDGPHSDSVLTHAALEVGPRKGSGSVRDY